MVILNGIAGTQDLDAFQSRNRPDEFGLNLFRKRRRDAVRINRDIIDTLGLEEDLMAISLAEAHNLVFDRRAVARAAPLDGA